MRKKIAYANQRGTSPNVIAEQYIELPRALCDVESAPIRGQKSTITKFYEKRYQNTNLITHCFGSSWTAEVVIMEGMFIIKTKPLNCHKIMEEYGHFLIRRFIRPHFHRGSSEVHMLFDNPGQIEDNPKRFEQARRDASLPADHLCWVFFNEAEIPSKWNETLKCRTCKRRLTQFLSSFFTNQMKQYIKEDQKFIVAGAADNNSQEAVVITHTTPGPYVSTELTCNAEETDTRIWLHVCNSKAQRILILSPDTDTYHIGLPLLPPEKEVIIQLSSPGARELNLLHLHKLVDALKRDPDMIHIPPTQIAGIVQAIFVSTGCDYVSFFSGIGKATFLKTFFEKAEFISNDNTGQLSKTPATMQELVERGFLPFIRLVGCAYFKKHRNAFQGTTPAALFHSFASNSVEEQHGKWLEYIRQKIWDRIMFEDDMIPSVGALKRHWKRSCWVLHMWRQATQNRMLLPPPAGNGWMKQDGKFIIDWDSKESMQAVRQRVDLLLKGCACKGGCNTKKCGCKKNGLSCGPGCRCMNCTNCSHDNSPQQQDLNDDGGDEILQVEIHELMEAIFGQQEENEEDTDDEEYLMEEEFMEVDEVESDDSEAAV